MGFTMNINTLRKSGLLAAAIAAAVLAAGCNNENAETNSAAAVEGQSDNVSLDTTQQKVTYIVGYNMAQQANANGLVFDEATMSLAIKDVADGRDPRIPADEQQDIMMSFQEEQQTQRDAEMQVVADENLRK